MRLRKKPTQTLNPQVGIAPLTAESILTNKDKFSTFISMIDLENMCNVKFRTGSYDSTLGIYRNGVYMYKGYRDWAYSSRSSYFYCISIAEKPEASIFMQAEESYYGHRVQPMEGEWLVVWRDGNWNLQGPWQSHIESLISTLLIEAEAHNVERQRKIDEERLRQQAEKLALQSRVSKAWS